MIASPYGTVDDDLTPWARLFPFGALDPITCIHLGIEYHREVVRAARWSSDLGHAPTDRSQFKIVLLHERPRFSPSKAIHHRTVICVPATRSRRQTQRIVGEITAAKQTAYLTDATEMLQPSIKL
mgnify:CR=1 FL=1